MLKKCTRAALVIALVLQLYGCAVLVAGAAGGGTVLWIKGKLQEEINASATQVHRATIAALRELELPILKNKKDKLTAVVDSRFADNKGVHITIKSLTASSSKISIRVGIVGNKGRSQKILKVIHSNL